LSIISEFTAKSINSRTVQLIDAQTQFGIACVSIYVHIFVCLIPIQSRTYICAERKKKYAIKTTTSNEIPDNFLLCNYLGES